MYKIIKYYMPDSGPSWAVAADITTAAANSLATSDINRKTQKWNEMMYDRQRGDALADYNMQNEYNSPTSQMARLREAGLNPNLVYGNGASAVTAAPVRSTDVKPWTPHAPEIPSGGAMVSNFYNTQLQQAQYDNLKTQNTVLTKDALLKEAQTANTNMNTANIAQNTARSVFDLGVASELRGTSIDAAKANLSKTLTDTQFTINQDDRNAVTTSMGLKTAAEAILRSRAERSKIPTEINHLNAQIRNLDNNSQLQQLDIKLKKLGIQPGDNMFFRALGQLIGSDNLPDKWPDFNPMSEPDGEQLGGAGDAGSAFGKKKKR